MASPRSDTPLLGLPRQPLTPQQQLEAIRRMQNQAEHRVKLGMQLFKAIESRVAEHRDTLSAIQAHEQQVRDRVHEDVARTLQEYDQWIGRIDENFTKALHRLEERFEKLARDVADSQGKVEVMLKRAEALLAQARGRLDEPPRADAAPPRPAEPPTADPAFDSKIYSQLLRRLRQSPDEDDRGRADKAA